MSRVGARWTRNFGARVSDAWTLHGMRTVVMENEFLRITILADKGTDIQEFLYKPLDLDFMWRSPIPQRDPAAAQMVAQAVEGPFLDHYQGGWQEILPSGGAPCVHKGVAYGLHDESCNLPWEAQIVEDSAAEVACRFSVTLMRTPLRVEKTLRLKRGEPRLLIDETLANLSPEPIDVMWGHHLLFGAPFLDDRCRIDTPARTIAVQDLAYTPTHRFPAGATAPWPRLTTKGGEEIDLRFLEPKGAGSEDMLYLLDLDEPWYALTHRDRRVTFALRWSPIFKHLWYWQVLGGGRGYPWYSRAYCAGLEPWTSWPALGIAECAKRGTQLLLGPHQRVDASLVASVATGFTEITHVSADGEVRGA